jgi:hypothetical protein
MPTTITEGSKRNRSPLSRTKLFLRRIFWAGFWLRVVVFCFLSPFNNDGVGHLEHILYFKTHWMPPPADFWHETFQPPLYYFLASFLARFYEDPKFLQMFSLLTSVGTLYLAQKLVCSSALIRRKEAKIMTLLIVAFLPQFVMFGLYLSNDSLAIFLGFLAVYRLRKFFVRATIRNFLCLMLVLSLSLLTKGQFLGICAVMVPVAWVWMLREHRAGGFQRFCTFAAAALLLAVGSMKYEQNALLYGKPLVTNLNFNPPWVAAQQGTYTGLKSVLDANILKLVIKPTSDESTHHAVPLLLYGTFWYQYIPESNFHGNLTPGLNRLGSWMYVVGVIPTLLLLVGLMALIRSPRLTLGIPGWRGWLRGVAVSVFAVNLAIVLWTFRNFDVWSILQARLLFPTLPGALVLLDAGIASIKGRLNLDNCLCIWSAAFGVGVAGYFGSEVILQCIQIAQSFLGQNAGV